MSTLRAVAHPIPWKTVRPEDVVPQLSQLIEDASARLDAIENGNDTTYVQTFAALELATLELERAMGVVAHLESVETSPSLREAYNAIQPEVTAFFTAIPLRAKLYARLRDAAGKLASLSAPQKRYVEKTLRDFERNGAALGHEQKQRLQVIDQELAQKTTRFSQNALDAANAFEHYVDDAAQLAGLPESAIEAARASATAKGKEGFRFSLQAPSVIAVLTYADNAELRKLVWTAWNTRASLHAGHDKAWANEELVHDILRLRQERAALLGYKNFADFVLEERMAKSGAAALAFVDELIEKTRAAFAREKDELLAFVRAEGGPTNLEPWDVSYWAEKARKAKFDFDGEALRPYFSAPDVLRGLFLLAEKIYGVTTRALALDGWNEAVQTFALEDKSGRELGVFYVDLYPRDSKRGGAWMDALITRDAQSPHVGLFCLNATPPMDGKPALLTHDEVETMFHEFGHLLHHLLTEVDVRSLAGTNVAWDFVELPSQIMENWAWEKEMLDLFARHYETGAPLPPELMAKMQRAQNYRSASQQMRQLSFAKVDLALHTDAEARANPMEFSRSVLSEFSPVPYPSEYSMLTSFTHLFAGSVAYAAGYYSYKWAEVLDADAFTKFKSEGIFSEKVGEEFRRSILSRGGSADAMELFVEFMGRKPNADALLERAGLR